MLEIREKLLKGRSLSSENDMAPYQGGEAPIWARAPIGRAQSRVQVLPTRARNSDIWDRRRIVNNMR